MVVLNGRQSTMINLRGPVCFFDDFCIFTFRPTYASLIKGPIALALICCFNFGKLSLKLFFKANMLRLERIKLGLATVTFSFKAFKFCLDSFMASFSIIEYVLCPVKCRTIRFGCAPLSVCLCVTNFLDEYTDFFVELVATISVFVPFGYIDGCFRFIAIFIRSTCAFKTTFLPSRCMISCASLQRSLASL